MQYKPDFEELKPYFQAFWNCEVLDRAALSVTAPRKVRVLPESVGNWSNPKKAFQEEPERILDSSIYHLDGVEALHHLDLLLEIPKLNAIQWVRGARFEKEGISRWFPLYRKIQAKKKSIIVYPAVEEIPLVLENLKPEGLFIQVACSGEDEARAVMTRLGWK